MVCAKEIGVEIEDGILKKVKFFGCYDGDSKTPKITQKDTYKGVGNITVKYFKGKI